MTENNLCGMRPCLKKLTHRVNLNGIWTFFCNEHAKEYKKKGFKIEQF